jgi:hypothetical protein
VQRLIAFFALALLATGCGNVASDTWLLGADAPAEKKVKCDGDHAGFYVCLGSASSIADATLAAKIETALASALPQLVNSDRFRQHVLDAFGKGGAAIDGDLTRADYAVTVTGYCDAVDDALAKAPLNGASIRYNECKGKQDLATVAGILLHEISHNLGYTHPDVNPSRSTVPYYLGDLAEKDLRTNGR